MKSIKEQINTLLRFQVKDDSLIYFAFHNANVVAQLQEFVRDQIVEAKQVEDDIN